MGLLNTTSNLIQRMRWAAAAGLQFGGARDLYTVFGYNKAPRHLDFVTKYKRQDVAKRVIDAPVDATWADPPILRNGVNGTVWQEFTDLAKATQLFAYLRKADIFAGLGQYAIMVFGLDDGRKLVEPVNTSRKNKITYIQPYLEGSITVDQFDENENSPRFGKPLVYSVTPGEISTQRTADTSALMFRKKFSVHYSRVLHLADNTLESSIAGNSRLEPIYNNLDDLMKVVGGSAETYWLTANRGLQIDIDKEMELDEQDAKDLSDEIEEYQHNLRRMVRTRGVKINNLGSDIADPNGVFDVLLALISSTTGIPQRVLMGAEAGQLASQQDRANWAIQVSNRISVYAEPYILVPLINLLDAANVVKKPENLYIDWPDPFKMNPLERAQTSAQMARSAVNVIRALEVAQKTKTPFLSVEESRRIVAPGQHMPVFSGIAEGTMPPPIEEVDPNKFLLPDGTSIDDTEDSETTGITPTTKDPDVSRPEDTRTTAE